MNGQIILDYLNGTLDEGVYVSRVARSDGVMGLERGVDGRLTPAIRELETTVIDGQG